MGILLLAEQDRSTWDQEQIRTGVALVGDGLRRTPTTPDPYVVQAAIAACHALAASYDVTDWNAIVSWYDVLLTVQDTPVVRLNRGVAIGERDGPEQGLAEVDSIVGLDRYALWHAARAELLDRVGRTAAAEEARSAALRLEANDALRRRIRANAVTSRDPKAPQPEDARDAAAATQPQAGA